MPNYENSKIYKIYSVSNEELVYFGSTTQRLSQRKAEHIKDSKKEYYNGSSKIIINNGNWKMELIQDYPCLNRLELETLEGEYIKNNKCINIMIPARTKKQYHDANRDKIRENQKKWRVNNPDYMKNWRANKKNNL
jgi:hypothetical protein|tara:strand:+ start:185 stop:592 length:408 start_codon:yes stop_codon:yes gene_type:complete